MPGGTSKEQQVASRKKLILELLALSVGGRAGYNHLTEQLAEKGCIVTERTVRNDCRDLALQGLVEKIRKGVIISRRGRYFLSLQVVPEGGVKEKHLKQVAILKLLYSYEKVRVKGMLAGDIAAYSGIGSEDAVKDILRAMECKGLVIKEGGRWRLGTKFTRPLSVNSRDARHLYEYLGNAAGMLPLSPVLKALKAKLVPVMTMPERGKWQESLVRVISRVIVHGRDGDTQDKTSLKKVVDLLEKAISSRQVIHAIYKGRAVRLRPLGVFYQWDKMNWYIISLISNKKTNYFRADRLERMELTGETFQQPDGFDLGEYMAARWGAGNDVETDVVVSFKNTGWHLTAIDRLNGEISRRHECGSACSLEELTDGKVLLRDRPIGLTEFASWVRGYGDAAEVLEPEVLRNWMATSARRMLARYGCGGEADEQ